MDEALGTIPDGQRSGGWQWRLEGGPLQRGSAPPLPPLLGGRSSSVSAHKHRGAALCVGLRADDLSSLSPAFTFPPHPHSQAPPFLGS